ncbi:MAG: hypothetical protein AAGB19_19510 [Cyanobacteria bacterium P01_F01_bin.3]
MKLQFFSIFSVLTAVTLTIPANGLAKSATAKASSGQQSHIQQTHQSRTSEGKNPDELIPAAKQLRTTVPIFTPRDDAPEPFNPFPPVITQPEMAPPPIATVTLHHTHRGASTGHTEQYANYKTWGGSDWTASIDSSGEFTHTHKGANTNHTGRVIQYISWDGQPWSATVNPTTGVFTHTRQGASSSHTDTILNYIGWDGAHWTMRLQ